MTTDIRGGGSAPTVGWPSTGMVAFLQRTLAIQRSPRSTYSAPSSSKVLWAVRRDWAIDRTHEFVCPRPSRSAALRQMAKDRAYWRRGPIRPELSIVRISAHEFVLHGHARRDCHAPDCSIATPATPTEMPAAEYRS